MHATDHRVAVTVGVCSHAEHGQRFGDTVERLCLQDRVRKKKRYPDENEDEIIEDSRDRFRLDVFYYIAYLMYLFRSLSIALLISGEWLRNLL